MRNMRQKHAEMGRDRMVVARKCHLLHTQGFSYNNSVSYNMLSPTRIASPTAYTNFLVF